MPPAMDEIAVISASASSAKYAYVLGRVEPRFPSTFAKEEFALMSLGSNTFSKPGNRHLARQLRWVLSVGGVDRFRLVPRYDCGVQMLVDVLNAGRRTMQAVIGLEFAMTSVNDGFLSVIAFDQIYSVLQPESSLFEQLSRKADNTKCRHEARVLNYCAARYPALYAKSEECAAADFMLSGIDVSPSPQGRARRILTVMFCFTNQETGKIIRFALRVDSTEEFPFLVERLKQV